MSTWCPSLTVNRTKSGWKADVLADLDDRAGGDAGVVNLAVSQERPKRPAPPRLPEGVKVLRDLPYVEGGHERNRLDLYLPEKAEGRLPLVVWIHGGAWQAGSKEGCPAVPLAAKGYAVASINYRLSQHAVFPAQIEDCKAAIRWLRANAAKYHLDPDHIGVWGASAGGHLVALLGTTGGVKELEGKGGNLDQSSRVQCVVDWFGPTDLATMGGRPRQPRLAGIPSDRRPRPGEQGEGPQGQPADLRQQGLGALPDHARRQGQRCAAGQSEVLAEALKKAGVEVKLEVVKGNGHGGPGFNSPENRKLIEDFFAKHLGKGRAAGKRRCSLAKKPHVAITISKETTYITGALAQRRLCRLRRRVEPAVPSGRDAGEQRGRALPEGHGARRDRREVSRRVLQDARHPAAPGERGLLRHARQVREGIEGRGEARCRGRRERARHYDIYAEQLTPAMKRPWSKKEFPLLAGWLAANEKPLALLVAASKRPRRYDPLIPEDGSVIGALLPAVSQYREAARALTARAMLRVDEGKVDEAWEDLLACHRLARLVGQGPTLIEALVAIAVDGMACAGDQGLLQHARLTPAQIARMRADLDKLPPLPKMVDKINVGERFMYLDCVGMVAREGLQHADRPELMTANPRACSSR